jgi:hypothetical protein
MARNTRLVDLEYHMPKEHREEAVIERIEEVEDVWVAGEGVEHCSSCGRDSDLMPMFALFYQGETRHICLRCVRRALEPEPVLKQVDTTDFPRMQEQAEQSEEPMELDSNQMSMFD